jgi:phosphoglycolate phosphatase/putative hydrolase of the HAD superfamily
MAWELLCSSFRSPRSGWRAARAIRVYRQTQEELRAENYVGDVAAEQLSRSCRYLGFSADYLTGCIEEWMNERPLDLLATAAFPGTKDFFTACRERDILLAAVSDYDPRLKLKALGLDRFFQVVVCAQDPEVSRFKPDPLVLRVAADRLGVKPNEALYIGDREDVDLPAARAAGMRAVLLTTRRFRILPCPSIRSFAELWAIFEQPTVGHGESAKQSHVANI